MPTTPPVLTHRLPIRPLSQNSNPSHTHQIRWFVLFLPFHPSHPFRRRRRRRQHPLISDGSHRYPATSSIGQKRATKIMLSDRRMPSFFSDAIVVKSDKRQQRRLILRRRSNGRRICRRRSASSGRAFLRKSVRSGKIVRKRRRKNTNSYIPTTFIGRSGPRQRNPRGGTRRPIRRAIFPSCSHCPLPRAVMVAQRLHPLHHSATNRYNFPTSTCLLALLRLP